MEYPKVQNPRIDSGRLWTHHLPSLSDGVQLNFRAMVAPFNQSNIPGALGAIAPGLLDGCQNPTGVKDFVGAVQLDATIKGVGAGLLLGALGYWLFKKLTK